jgi:hypothetical protein
MTPLLFAAALAGSPFVAQPGQSLDLSTVWQTPRITDFKILGSDPTHACANLSQLTVAPDGTPLLKRLDQLPRGVMEHAVWRTVGGCPVREIVFGGQTYYMASTNPQLERLDPVARPSR